MKSQYIMLIELASYERASEDAILVDSESQLQPHACGTLPSEARFGVWKKTKNAYATN